MDRSQINRMVKNIKGVINMSETDYLRKEISEKDEVIRQLKGLVESLENQLANKSVGRI